MIKFFIFGGLVMVCMAVTTVIARCVVALFGDREQAARVHLPFAN
jgi:hypothetical protein